MEETGGTVRVQGTLAFNYTVHSEDCNVFTIEELVQEIRNDPIGWLIDMYLGSAMPPLHESMGEKAKRETYEKYAVIDFNAFEDEVLEVDQTETITEKYVVPEE